MHIAALICQPASNFPTKLLLILYKRLSTFHMVGGKPSGADLRFETGFELPFVAKRSLELTSVSPVCADDGQLWL